MRKFYSLTVLFLLGLVSAFAQSISLTSPNGGEVWDNGTTQNIVWTTSGTIPQVDILYSTDNGVTYNNITTFETNNDTYAWLVPDTINSANCKIIVIDSQTGNYFDESNQVFTIQNATESITLIQPNGGEMLNGGSTYEITWNSNNVNYLFIDFSSDGGNTWQFVNDGIPGADGSYNWTVPAINSTNCLIKITSHTDGNAIDSSAFAFEINTLAKSLTLTSPNGGEVWIGGSSSYNYINWTSSNVNKVALYYSTDNGVSYTLIDTNVVCNNGSNNYYWLTPNTPSTGCLVKVVDQEQTSLFDGSDAAFTISNAIVTVVNPNGGENLVGGNTTTINWYSQGLSSYVNLYYSIDNGATWNYISYSSNTNNSSNNSYTWTIPQTVAACVKIKIEDYYTNTISDVSDACLSINAAASYVSLVSPNGGEQWTVGTYKYIYWNSQNVAYVNLEYTIDGGASWNTIASSVTASSGSYNWYIPNYPSATCQVRITDPVSAQSDISNAYFTILSPVLTVSSPNGGEMLNTGSTYTIYVGNTGPYTYANLDYSTDNGSTWTNITTAWYIGQSNNNYYSWTVPNTPSTQCLVKVTDYYTASLYDISDANFTIVQTPPSFTVTSPTYGEVIVSGADYSIVWTASNSSSSQLEYSTDSGATWTLIADNITTYNGTNYFTWSTPTGINSTKCLVRVSDQNVPSYFDVNNGVFSIVPESITVTNANGGEVLQTGSSYDIGWTSVGTSGYVSIDYKTSPTGAWNPIVAGASNSGSYNWTVTGLASNTCKFRISDYYNTAITDQSDYNFTIAADQGATLTLTSLNGGDVIQTGSQQYIYWNYSGVTDVKIEYNLSGNSPAGWVTATASTSAAQGYYLWTTPSTPSNTVRVRISDVSNGAVADMSYSDFKLVNPGYTILSPNGGETFQAGTTEYLEWTSVGVSNYVKIDYSLDNGSTWNNIINGTYNYNYYNWAVPASISSTQALIRVSDYYNNSFTDASDAVFEISPSTPTLTLTSFDGGQDVAVGTTQYIYWNYNNVSTVKLEYSTNNGSSWNYIDVAAASQTYYAWIVPNTPSDYCKIRISDNSNSSVLDISSYNFAISTSGVTLFSPNGGEIYTAGNTRSITWFSEGLSSYVNLYYSTDSGSTWNYINYSYNYNNQSNNYNWTIPISVSSANCLISVSDYYTPSLGDTSDATFTINPAGPSVVLSYPNGGEQFTAGSTIGIQWTSTNINYLKLEYSINNGASWTTIVDSTTASSNYYAWTAPSIVSNTVKVRVSSTANASVFDASNNFFSIAIPTIVVTMPNGGEDYTAGTTQPVTWYSTGLSNYVNLYYSTDNGSTWNYISYSYNNNNQSNTYSWSIPGSISSTNCLIAVSDYYTPAWGDTSNALFTISPAVPTITLTSPNGGEIWSTGTSQYISWTATSVSSFNVEYSTDNGATWNFIVNTSSQGYNWTVPNTPSATCLVRVSDAGNSSLYDVSSSTFSIVTPGIVISSPNGGENYTAGTAQYIYWNAVGLSSYVNLYYSIDAGSTWNYISYGYNYNNQTSSYYWNIPSSISSTNCLIKIEDYYTPSLMDVSDSVFTISASAPYITLTSPGGGENWAVNSSYNITWYSNNVTDIKIEYSADNGSTWNTIVASTPASNGSYNWTIPSIANTCNAMVRLSDVATGAITATSSTFCIGTPTLTVISPNGGEMYTGGTTQTISWYSESVSNYVNLYYSIDNGSTWNYISYSYNNNNQNNSYSWTIPNSITSTNCLIKVADYYNANTNDVSDGVFEINAPVLSVQVTSPNGGETWQGNTVQNITWTSSNLSSYVNISLSTDGGASFGSTFWASNTGSYSWTVPNTPSTECRIKVADYYTGSAYDISDTNFTITQAAPSITVTYPNGGEAFVIGSQTYIGWNSTSVSDVNIDYSTDGGNSWTSVATNISAASGYYNWTVPNTPSANCKVRITDVSNSALSDISNNSFTISTPYLTVTSPNGGETWGIGSYRNITWSSAGVSYVNIYYSTDNGVAWNTIVTSYSGTYYGWTVPNNPSANCRVKIEDANNTSLFDISNNTFTIPNPSVVLTSPNGGEQWTVGTSYYIYWTANGLSYVNLEYSTDGGISWSTIVTATSATQGYYNWAVPNNPSQACRVRVTDYYNSSVTDMSDNNFSIVNPSIALNSPNGAEQWIAGTTHQITWTSAYANSYVKLYYSTNAGSSWNLISNAEYNDGSYTWTVPNDPSTTCLVKVVDYYNSNVLDVSNNYFTILAPQPSVTVISPNGGENWSIGTGYYIQWNSVSVSDVKIEYSYDAGSTYNTIVASTASQDGNNYYLWTIPNTPNTECLVKVTSVDNASVNDVSNNFFTIPTPSLALTTPNGNEVWGAGTSKYIYWTSTSVANVKLEYTTNNGTVWNTIIASTSGNNGYYLWNIPTGINSTQCKVRIKSVINTALMDMSNFNFTIAPTSLTVTAPNGGETLTGLSNRTVSWTGVGLSNYVNIDYSTDGGTTWVNAVTGVYNNGSYNWSVPNVASANCKVRVTDYYNAALTDVSNAVFTITQATPSITLYSPNGGENYLVGSTYYIYWSSQSIQNVKIEYSIDGGANYMLVSSNTVASQGYYYWYVPNTASANCLVRISDAANSSVNDISNALFSINQPVPAITVTTPNGGEVYAQGGYQYITWTSQVVNVVNIDISYNNGSTWNTIASGVDATVGYYYYVTPAVQSTTCLVKITDGANASLYDVSNATFEIYQPVVNNNTIATTAVSDTMFCKGDSMYVNYAATGVYNAGNVFTVQLSDANGNFSNPVSIGYKASTNLNDSIWAVIPEYVVNGTDYRVRVVSNDLPATGSSNGTNINIGSPEFDYATNDGIYVKYLPHGEVTFVYNAISDSTGYTYNWQFGTGDSSSAASPVYEYTAPGFYTVSLTATSLAGCSTTIERINYMDIEQIFPTIPTQTQNSSSGYSAISMYNQFTGIAVGDNGTIQVTNDGGVNWTPVTASNVTGTLTGVYVVSADTAFIVSNTGSIFGSYDAGLSWTLITNAGAQLNGIEFSNSTTGFAVGANGTIIRLNFTGTYWNPTTVTGTGITGNCNAVTAAGGVTGCVDNTGKAYIKDANGWSQSYSGSVSLNGMNFLNPNYGYAVGDNGTIVRYKNGNWEKVYDGLTSNFKNIQIKDDMTAYAIGDDGIVYVTEDGGDNFDRYSLGNTSNMRGMAYKSGKGVIVGQGSIAFRFGGNGLGIGELDTAYCAGETFELEYFVSGEFRATNTFRAELSDANADFTSARIIGSVNSNTFGTMTVTLPDDLEAGTGYHIRISSTDSAMVSPDNGFDIEIFAKPAVALGADTSICSGGSISLDAANTGAAYSWNNGATTQSISVNTAGGYTVQVTGANGCKGNDSIYVDVINTLAVDLGSDFSVCSSSGLEVELNANVLGATYSWSTGATTPEITATTAGTYSVTVSKCAQTVSDEITITFNAAPAVPTVSQSGATMHAATSATGVTYQWYQGNVIGAGTLVAGATADSLMPSDTGWFYVAVISAQGCASFSDPFRYSGVGYQELAINGASAMVYPNPSTGMFTLQYNNTISQSVSVKIVNVVGQTIMEQEINSTAGTHRQNIDLSKVVSGVYFITVSMNNTNFTQQLMIQR